MTTWHRIIDFICTIGTGCILLVTSYIGYSISDIGAGSTYAAGLLLFFGIPFVAIYFLCTMFLSPAPILRAPKIHLAYLFWMALGAAILTVIERAQGVHYANPPLTTATMVVWLLAFPCGTIIMLILTCKNTQKKKTESPELSNYPRDDTPN